MSGGDRLKRLKFLGELLTYSPDRRFMADTGVSRIIRIEQKPLDACWYATADQAILRTSSGVGILLPD